MVMTSSRGPRACRAARHQSLQQELRPFSCRRRDLSVRENSLVRRPDCGDAEHSNRRSYDPPSAMKGPSEEHPRYSSRQCRQCRKKSEEYQGCELPQHAV